LVSRRLCGLWKNYDFALQTGRNEYAVLSGFEESEILKQEDSVDVSVLTPTAPRQFSEYELFKLILTIYMMR
jgi:hypothetical protein